jgi:serine/threonine protein kinase
LKELHKAEILKHSDDSISLLLNERKILSKVSGGTYLCSCYSANQDQHNLFLILEFCAGGELEYHLKKLGSFPEEELAIYLAQLIYGIHELHTEYK